MRRIGLSLSTVGALIPGSVAADERAPAVDEASVPAVLEEYLLVEQAALDFANEATVDELRGILGARADSIAAARPFASVRELRVKGQLEVAELEALGVAAKRDWVPSFEEQVVELGTFELTEGGAPSAARFAGSAVKVETDLGTCGSLSLGELGGGMRLVRDGCGKGWLVARAGIQPTLPGGGDYELIPGKLEMPNLKIRFDEHVTGPMAEWAESFDVDAEVEQERCHPALCGPPAGIRLGIFKLTPADTSNNEDKLANVTAEMYEDEITIKEWLS